MNIEFEYCVSKKSKVQDSDSTFLKVLISISGYCDLCAGTVVYILEITLIFSLNLWKYVTKI